MGPSHSCPNKHSKHGLHRGDSTQGPNSGLGDSYVVGKEKLKERGGDTDELRSWPAREGAMEMTIAIGR